MHDQLLLIDNNVRKVFDETDRHIDGFRIRSSELRIDRMYYDSILANKVRLRLIHYATKHHIKIVQCAVSY
jgi:hypothetical protein